MNKYMNMIILFICCVVIIKHINKLTSFLYKGSIYIGNICINLNKTNFNIIELISLLKPAPVLNPVYIMPNIIQDNRVEFYNTVSSSPISNNNLNKLDLPDALGSDHLDKKKNT